MNKPEAIAFVQNWEVDLFTDPDAYAAARDEFIAAYPRLACPNCSGTGCPDCDSSGLACPTCRNSYWVRATRSMTYPEGYESFELPTLKRCPTCVTIMQVDGVDTQYRDRDAITRELVRAISEIEPAEAEEIVYTDENGEPVPF